MWFFSWIGVKRNACVSPMISREEKEWRPDGSRRPQLSLQ